MPNSKLQLLKQLYLFMKENKKWWLAPLIILIVLFGLLLVFAQGSVFAPFIYTLF